MKLQGKEGVSLGSDRLVRCLVMAMLICSVTACKVVAARPIKPGTDTYYSGYITQGWKFGVEIGQSREDAKQTLTKGGFLYRGTVDCSYGPLNETIECHSDQKSDAYNLRKTFRQGELYVSFADDKVTSIVWSFNLLPSIDW